MCKVETAWVIQRDDGKFGYFYYKDDVHFSDRISFESMAYREIDCKMWIKELNLKNCKPVKIEIKVVEE